jgi:thiamine kinase-like enzyme
MNVANSKPNTKKTIRLGVITTILSLEYFEIGHRFSQMLKDKETRCQVSAVNGRSLWTIKYFNSLHPLIPQFELRNPKFIMSPYLPVVPSV